MFYSLGNRNPYSKSSDVIKVQTSQGTKCVRFICTAHRCDCVPDIASLYARRIRLESQGQSQRFRFPWEQEQFQAPWEHRYLTRPQPVVSEESIRDSEADERAWQFASEFIGKDAVDKLRAGGHYDVDADNGKRYRITGNGQVYNLSERSWYCLHTTDDDNKWDRLPIGDQVASMAQWIKYKPQYVDSITSGSHSRPCRLDEKPCWD